jgi:hypothetical protein
MFSDEYLQYIINLPEKPKENINEGIYPKWITNSILSPDIVPIRIGCKYGKHCKEENRCPYLHPRFEYSDVNPIQVTNLYINDDMNVNNKYQLLKTTMIMKRYNTKVYPRLIHTCIQQRKRRKEDSPIRKDTYAQEHRQDNDGMEYG